MHNKGRLVDEDEVSVMEYALVIVLIVVVAITVKGLKIWKRRGREHLKEALRTSYREEYTKRFLPLNLELQQKGAQAPQPLVDLIKKANQIENEFARFLGEEQLDDAESKLNEFAVLLDDAEKAFKSSNEATPH